MNAHIIFRYRQHRSEVLVTMRGPKAEIVFVSTLSGAMVLGIFSRLTMAAIALSIGASNAIAGSTTALHQVAGAQKSVSAKATAELAYLKAKELVKLGKWRQRTLNI